MAEQPKISFLIATDDHPPDLDCFFGALVAQTLSPDEYEVVIIDSSRTHDLGPAYEKCMTLKDARLRLVYEAIDKGGRAKAYNRGLPLCRAPIVLFFGDDFLAAPQTAEIHLKYHQENQALNLVGVGSAILPPELRTRFAAWLEESGELYGVPFSDDMTSVPENFFYIGNTSVKREFLKLAGSFDEAFPYHAWDDFELGLRLTKNGMKAVYLPAAKAEHVHDIPLRERCRAMMQAGECAVIFGRKYGGQHPWHDKCRIPPWRYRLHSAKVLLQYALTRSDEYIYSYYRARLALSFVAGYRRADGRFRHNA